MFDRHQDLVWRVLRRSGLDSEAAADVSQQAYLVAIERIDDICPGSERAFLLGTALRLAHKRRRTDARARLEGRVYESLHQPVHAESQAMALELLDRTLPQLDASLVEVLVLFGLEGFSTHEIASALALPEGTVSSRLRRARAALRTAMRRLELTFEHEERRR